MSYTINRTITGATLEDIDTRTRSALSDHGFGVLTEIDVQSTLNKKIGAEIDGYRILGACNPTWPMKHCRSNRKSGQCCPVT